MSSEHLAAAIARLADEYEAEADLHRRGCYDLRESHAAALTAITAANIYRRVAGRLRAALGAETGEERQG